MFKFIIKIVLFLAFHSISQASDSKILTRKGPYIHCNVILSDACFGTVKGDKLSKEFAIDFLIYRLTFSSGRTAVIYYGFNPNINDKEANIFQPCVKDNGFSSCKQRILSDGGYELIARRDEESLIIHTVISGGSKAKIESMSFLNNIRACKKIEQKITCAP
jgi:hypothetical protein